MIIAFLSPFNIPKFVIKIKLRQKIESKQSRNILENICEFELGYSSSLSQLFNHSKDIMASFHEQKVPGAEFIIESPI